MKGRREVAIEPLWLWSEREEWSQMLHVVSLCKLRSYFHDLNVLFLCKTSGLTGFVQQLCAVQVYRYMCLNLTVMTRLQEAAKLLSLKPQLGQNVECVIVQTYLDISSCSRVLMTLTPPGLSWHLIPVRRPHSNLQQLHEVNWRVRRKWTQHVKFVGALSNSWRVSY